jgi:hypothetical protein
MDPGYCNRSGYRRCFLRNASRAVTTVRAHPDKSLTSNSTVDAVSAEGMKAKPLATTVTTSPAAALQRSSNFQPVRNMYMNGRKVATIVMCNSTCHPLRRVSPA